MPTAALTSLSTSKRWNEILFLPAFQPTRRGIAGKRGPPLPFLKMAAAEWSVSFLNENGVFLTSYYTMETHHEAQARLPIFHHFQRHSVVSIRAASELITNKPWQHLLVLYPNLEKWHIACCRRSKRRIPLSATLAVEQTRRVDTFLRLPNLQLKGVD